MLSERIKRLREQVVRSKAHACSERALIITESYKETEGQPEVLRRAKAFKKITENVSVKIFDDELIVGLLASDRRAGPVFPEFSIFWWEEELDTMHQRPQDKVYISPKVKEDLKTIFPYWKGKTLYDRVMGTLPPDVRKARQDYLFTIDPHEGGGLAHVFPDLPKVLSNGFQGIKNEINEKLENAHRFNPADFKKIFFWQAAAMVCDAIMIFARRHSDEALRLAKIEQNEKRRSELLKIAEVCKNVPAHPANNFWEAVQAAWFVQLLIQLETNGTGISPGRLDQHFYPYYLKDMKENGLTKDEAQEIINCLWLKFNEPIKIYHKEATFVHAGWVIQQNVTIGGVNKDGRDATNDVTYMCLNAHEDIRLPQPQFSIRIHENTPEELFTNAARVVKGGGGMPQFVSDAVFIPSLMNRGIPLAEARDYGLIGCVEGGVIDAWLRCNGGYFNLAKVFELALNDGVDRLSGERVGIKSGDPRRFKSIEDVINAFEQQMKHFLQLLVTENHVIDIVHGQYMPHLVPDLLYPGCIKRGLDISEGGALYNWTGVLGVGLPNITDSLAAIQKVVFEDKTISMAELIDVLDRDFKGYDKIHQQLTEAPKYGNDDDYVDRFVQRVSSIYFDNLERFRSIPGGVFVPSLLSLSVCLPFGWKTGALPDGRRASTPLTDSVSPGHGCDRKGPTGVFKSVTKFDHTRVTGGLILNQKFTPTLLSTESNLKKFSDLLKTYLIDLKGEHVQVNVISADTLRDAQTHPEKYPDLIIRVTGYCAYFNELSKEVQNDVIERTEQAML